MKFEVCNNEIKIYSLDEFNPMHIFECGQVFAYKKLSEDAYVFYPDEYVFLIYKKKEFYAIKEISGKSVDKAVEIFDLNTDYGLIKNKIKKLINKENFAFNRQLILKAIDFGYGIRILKQEPIEIIISFIFSENNNIKRIKKSLDLFRERIGNEIKIDVSRLEKQLAKLLEGEKFYSFPILISMANLDEMFFSSIGAGYRANYLVSSIAKLQDMELPNLDTKSLRAELLTLKGVGRKVADCILLFGFNKKDVFPVDTWIKQVYDDINSDKRKKLSALKISDELSSEFSGLSGYVQQYLFYYKRENT